ncbi:MAG: glycoside hydrolase family 3 N-terminal domain-containing protein [Cyclobacteriaceae bacterium]
MKKLAICAVYYCVSILMTSCISEGKTEEYKTLSTDIDRKVEALLDQMTVQEKVGQMAQLTLDVITKGETKFVSDEPLFLDDSLVEKALGKYHVGSILNTANNRARSRDKWAEVIGQIQDFVKNNTRLHIPVIYGIDAIHGTTYTEGATMFPQQIGQAATFNRSLVLKAAAVTAYETRASSIPWNFSPVLDLGRDPRFPRFWETFGEDVYLTTEMGRMVIEGYEGVNNDISSPTKVASCLKHFLGYSIPLSGKDRTPAYIPEIELRERHLPAFEAAIEAGAHSVMINSGIINGIPVHGNYNILTKLLKQKLNFQGVVITDWNDINNLHSRDRVASSPKEAVKMAINAGIDMSMIPYDFEFCDYLIELVEEGEVSLSRIDDAVKRILTMKYQLGLFKNPIPGQENYSEFGSKKYENIAYQTASESITLLKNKNNILPLKKGGKILVTGPNANSMRALNGAWTYSWQGEKVEEYAQEYNTILEAIRIKNDSVNVLYEPGVAYKENGKYWEENVIDFDKVVEAAAKVDYILLCLGENSYTEKPGDLHDLELSKHQIDLAKVLVETGKPIILVLNQGRPRLIQSIEFDMSGVLNLYLPGNFGGDALADILFGDVNPSGKLPFTYPMFANTLVNYDHKPSEEQDKMEGVYDYESDFAIQYPFGHGLSYSEFEYTNLNINKTSISVSEEIKISVEVKNISSRPGKEVVQLFVSDLYASITPDVMRLRRFDKIELKPGESKIVEFQLQARDLAFVGNDLKWRVEKGEYQAKTGNLEREFSISEDHEFNQVDPVL